MKRDSNIVKCIFVLPDLSGGGAERVTIDLIKSLDRSKFQVSLFLLRKSGAYLSQIPLETKVYFGLETDGSILKNAARIIKKLNATAKENDVIIGSLELIGHLFATIASISSRKPNIAWLHKHLGYYLDALPIHRKLIYKSMARSIYKKVNKIVAVSESSINSVIELFPKYRNKSTYIYNPVDFERIIELSSMEMPDWFRILQERQVPIVLAVGRLEFQKGFDLLISAFSNVKKRGYSGILVILGEGGERQALTKRIKQLDLQNDIFLPGFANPYPIMANCDLFVLSSRYEGLPTVLIEALAFDLQIVSTDCPSGPKEILQNLKSALLIRSEDIVEMEQAIISKFTENKNIQESKVKSRHRFEKKNVSEKWEELILKVVKENENSNYSE